MENENSSYEIEDILAMLGGDQYYSMDQIMYVYHSLRKETEEAEYYMKQLELNMKNYERKLNKLRRANKNLELETDNDIQIVDMMENVNIKSVAKPKTNNIELLEMEDEFDL